MEGSKFRSSVTTYVPVPAVVLSRVFFAALTSEHKTNQKADRVKRRYTRGEKLILVGEKLTLVKENEMMIDREEEMRKGNSIYCVIVMVAVVTSRTYLVSHLLFFLWFNSQTKFCFIFFEKARVSYF